MKFAQAIALCASLVSLNHAALTLTKKSVPAVVAARTQRRNDVGSPLVRDRRKVEKRQSETVQVSLENDITLYYINVSLGTPATDFALHIDTGSSDLWVNTAASPLCQRYSQACAAAGVYNSASSSTYHLVNNDFNVTYADGSAALGPYVTDTLGIGDVTVENFQFGVGATSSSPAGICGIGYASNEGVVQTSARLEYANLPRALQNAGAINTVAYSLYLDDLESSTGSILFGGVDTTKYNGTLQTLPIIPTYGYYSEFLVALTGVGVNGNANSLVSNEAVAVLLDSGTSLTYLPDNVVNSLYSEYGLTYNEQEGVAVASCSLANQQGSVEFTFSSLTISVPLSELVINVSQDPRVEQCAFGIAPASTVGLAVMGDTFLRSAYIVYDLSNNEISMAQANFDTTGSDVQEIQSGTSSVPDATAVANPVTSVANVYTGAIGQVGPTSLGGLGSSSGNAAQPMVTPPPTWRYGSGILAGAAALAMI